MLKSIVIENCEQANKVITEQEIGRSDIISITPCVGGGYMVWYWEQKSGRRYAI